MCNEALSVHFAGQPCGTFDDDDEVVIENDSSYDGSSRFDIFTVLILISVISDY